MDIKEANSSSFSKKKSYDMKFKQKLEDHYQTTAGLDQRNSRSIIKSFLNLKPKRSSSGGQVPRNKMNVGNAGKTMGCRFCFLSLNHMINKRTQKKCEIKYAIDFGCRHENL